MKRISLIVVLILITLSAFANSYYLSDVKDEWIGTYIPVDLELRLYQSKKFYESLEASRYYGQTRPHDVLYLRKINCYSDVAFHDGYAIETKQFENYKFITSEGGVFCIDDNGYLYRRISEKTDSAAYIEFVIKIILSNYLNSSEIKTEDCYLYINNKQYRINLDGLFFDTKDTAVLLYDEIYRDHYFLEKHGNDGELYTSKVYAGKVSDYDNQKDKLIERFSGMFRINQNELPDYLSVPKDQLRLFRNLIFARNGYTFKSKDLQDYFNSCSWYKPNPAFKESNLRKDEKDFISLIKQFE